METTRTPQHPEVHTAGGAEALPDRTAREDLVAFVNACFACTGQREFYADGRGLSVSIDFLHQYILGNYRLLYARTLASGINHYSQQQIILNLLATGKDAPPSTRAEEGQLIRAALARLPAQRAFGVLQALRRRKINNRRARAVARDYLAARPDPAFFAVKYRSKLRAAAVHAHLALTGETGAFLFKGWKQRVFQTPLYETFRQAHYAEEAIYRLPFSIAEGLAAQHGVERALFLKKIAPQMTQHERLRLTETAKGEGVDLGVDLARARLTRLALYILSLDDDVRAARKDELAAALQGAAARTLSRAPFALGRTAAVLDRSFSSSGSSEKRRRPLAVALASSFLLRAAASAYRACWSIPTADEVLVTARGQTDLARPLLDALDFVHGGGGGTVVIVSDGFENDPPHGAAEIVRAFRARIDPKASTSVVHLNPVFDPDHFAPRPIGPALPTVGLRDAEDLPTMLGFARFAAGDAPIDGPGVGMKAELEAYLAGRARALLTVDAGAP